MQITNRDTGNGIQWMDDYEKYLGQLTVTKRVRDE